MRPLLDLSLYLVTDTEQCGGPDAVVDVVSAAVRGGVTLVQLRDHAASDDDLVRLGRRLVTLLAPHGVPLVVNDRADLVGAIGADGIHVGQEDLDVREARALVGPDALVGLSVQSVDHVEAARLHGTAVDYLGVGPLWPTATKPDHAPPSGIATAAGIVAASPWPCVLIGGITADRVSSLPGTGADGIAVVSAVCAARDPEAAARDLRQRWERGRVDLVADAPQGRS